MIALLAMAWAGVPEESNLSATSVGAQFWQSSALAGTGKSQDVDILLGQRLRWTLKQTEAMAIRFRTDARFTLGPGDQPFLERHRVRQLGASLITRSFTLDVGRNPIQQGGPRLVDGLQFVAHTSSRLDIGAWGGLAPDLFTTLPRARYGGGPIIAYAASRLQASVVGEFLIGGGSLDRAGVLAQGRISAARTLEVSGRLDLDLASIDGLHLQDSQVYARWSPGDTTNVDLFWDAFSSYRYRNTENLDPDIQRFALRLRPNDLRLDAVLQDCLEPKVAQAVGTNLRLRPERGDTGLQAGLKGRYRFGGKEDFQLVGQAEPKCGFDDINTFVRVNPMVGLAGLPIAGTMDLSIDANYYVIDGKTQYDAGFILFWEPSDQGTFAFDTSYRLLINPYDAAKNPGGYDAPGHYVDVFVDLVIPNADFMLGTGLNVVSEPGVLVDDLGVGAFARVTKYLRGKTQVK